jgi:ribosomal protein L30/L7E
MKINLKIFFFIIQNDITKLLGISKIYSEVIRNTIETYKGLIKILKK